MHGHRNRPISYLGYCLANSVCTPHGGHAYSVSSVHTVRQAPSQRALDTAKYLRVFLLQALLLCPSLRACSSIVYKQPLAPSTPWLPANMSGNLVRIPSFFGGFKGRVRAASERPCCCKAEVRLFMLREPRVRNHRARPAHSSPTEASFRHHREMILLERVRKLPGASSSSGSKASLNKPSVS